MTKKELIEKFSKVGTSEIVEDNELEVTILTIFQTYPKQFFTQPQLVKGLDRSNPFINKILRRLVEKKKLNRVRQGNKFYYNLSQ